MNLNNFVNESVGNSLALLAEGEGFEPSRACAQHAFQACAIDH